MFDMVSRWAGGASISPAKYSKFLCRWTADPADEAEGYVLDALGELGKQTLPAYDIAKGADADAPLPLQMVIQEQIALSALDVEAPTAAQPQGLLMKSETGTMCDTIATSKSIAKNSSKAWDWLVQNGENWGNVGTRVEQLGSAAAEAEGGAGAAAESGSGIGIIILIASGMIQNAMAHGYLYVDLAQDPRPVAKHKQGAQPNQTVLTVTLKGDKDIPKDFASCMKLLGGLGVTLGQPGQPVAKATVTVTAGANFARHLTWASGSPPGDRTTDADGQITVPLLTKPQSLPKGQGTVKTREAMVHVVASLQHLSISPSALVAKAMEKVARWSNDYAIEVTQREKPALP
ncbi:MAG: hypothetical protein ABIQ39_14875 [Ilumatobacteraceae bacterium]